MVIYSSSASLVKLSELTSALLHSRDRRKEARNFNERMVKLQLTAVIFRGWCALRLLPYLASHDLQSLQLGRHTLLHLLASLALGITLIVLALGYLGKVAAPLDSFSHFRAHAAISALFLSVGLWALGLIGPAVLGAVCSGLSVAAVASAYIPAGRPSTKISQRTFQLLHLNVLRDHPTPAAAIALINEVDADIVSLNEVTGAWIELLEEALPTYTSRLICFDGLLDGSAILAKHPWSSTGPAPSCSAQNALASATADLEGTSLAVYSLHLLWPWPRRQSQQIEAIRQDLSPQGVAAILAGDFNAVPWSAATRRIADAGGFELIRGYGSTWLLHSLPRAFVSLGLPIDQVMSRGLAIHDVRTLRDVGSDHLPVLVEFSFNGDQSLN